MKRRRKSRGTPPNDPPAKRRLPPKTNLSEGILTEITVNGIKLSYLDEGSGNTVLLLHGWGSSKEIWRPFINALSSELRFVALDFPGCGKSDLPANPLDTDDYAALTAELINRLGLENVSLVGHSHGGRVAMKLAGEGIVSPRRMVLIDAAGVKPKKSLKKSFKIACYKTARRVLTLPPLKNRTADTLDRLRAHFGSQDYRDAPEVMRKTLVKLVNDDVTPILGNITCPTFLIWGDKDTATPLYMAHTIESRIKDTGLCVYEGTGHFSFIEQPGRTTAILRSFLGGKDDENS